MDAASSTGAASALREVTTNLAASSLAILDFDAAASSISNSNRQQISAAPIGYIAAKRCGVDTEDLQRRHGDKRRGFVFCIASNTALGYSGSSTRSP